MKAGEPFSCITTRCSLLCHAGDNLFVIMKRVFAPWLKDLHGVLEYQTDLTQFQAVSSLTLFFPTNLNGDGATEIWYVGLRGEGTGNRRDMIVTAVGLYKLNSVYPYLKSRLVSTLEPM
jgi:hypothetical protein